jgi:subtilisin-like proprotein convertase family protein
VTALLAVPALAQSVTTLVNSTDGAVGSARTRAAPPVRTFSVTNSFILADVDLGVCVQHSQRGEMRVTLQASKGARVQLVDSNTAITGYHCNVRLDDPASALVNSDGNNRNHST